MNTGTKVRTALVIAVSIHTALLATDITGFDNPTADLVYRIASIAVNFVVVALSTYYNNDYTEEACEGTGLTRQLKAMNSGDYEETGDTEDGSVVDDEEGEN